MSTVKYMIRVRSYPDRKFQSVWVVRVDGAMRSGMMWGEMLPTIVQELASALRLDVEYEDSPFHMQPMTAPECLPVEEQKELFE